MSKKLLCLTLFAMVAMAKPVGADTISISTPKGAEPAPPGLLVTIPVPDAGFDDHVLNNVGDWIYVGDAAYTGAWKSAGGDAWIDYGYYAADVDLPALSGNNKLYPYESTEDYVYQILDKTFIEGATYTLSVWVGLAWSGYDDNWSLYFTSEDHANNLAETSGNAPVGSWGQVSLVYTATAADTGKNIGIKMTGAIYVTFENVTLSYVGGAEPGVTIPVDPNSDIAAANELAQAGDTIEFAAGTYYITSQIEIKDGVTYQGAGPGLTIIDGNDVTRAFVAWGDRGATNGQVDANGLGVPNNTGPKAWLLKSMTIQNCVADTENRQDILSSARDLLNNYTGTPYTLVAAQDENGGIEDNPEWFDLLSGGSDDDLTDVELQAYLDTNPVGSDGHLTVNDDKTNDGGAITIHDGAVGTIANCDFLANHTPAGGGDDGGAINITGLSVITIDDCWFDGNYAVSPHSVSVDGSDGDAGHIKVQGNTPTNGFINAGTTLIATRCVFLNGSAEDDAGAIQANAQGVIARLDSCWFEGNTAWDNGTVLQFPNEDQHEATVINCVFANNVTKSDNSPDRMCEVRRNTKFINCTFVGNVQEDQDLIYNNANNADGDHDGTDDELADTTQVVNCIFVNNVVGNGDDVLGSRNANFTIAATNCLFFGNTLQNGNAADNTQRPAEEVGSIMDDPLLDALLHIPGLGSPAIDAGIDPAIVGVTVTTDFNGDPRPQGAGYDIGAFETPAN